MKNQMTLTAFLCLLFLGIGTNTDAQQWTGSTTTSGTISRTGDVQLTGRKLLLGPDQSLYGDNSSALYYTSNNSNYSQFILRDKENTAYGRLYGSNEGSYFGLVDADGTWSYLAKKDEYTQLRINNAERLLIKDNATRIRTASGYVDIGAINPSYAHFYTDRPSYYFDKEVKVNSGFIGSYDEDLSLRTQGSTKLTVKKTNGNVGIGTTNPLQKLDVNGSIRLKNLYTPYQTKLVVQNGNNTGNYQFAIEDNDDTHLRMWNNGNGNRVWQMTNRGDTDGQFDLITYSHGQTAEDTVMSAYPNGDVEIGNRLLLKGEGQSDTWKVGVRGDKNRFVICKDDGISCLEFATIDSKGSTQWGIDGRFGESKHHFFGEVCVDFQGNNCAWPDYVFEEGHEIMELDEVEAFVKENKHLPFIQSAAEIEENGLSVHKTMSGLTKQIEELTLHTIDQGKSINSKDKELEELESEMEALKKRFAALNK